MKLIKKMACVVAALAIAATMCATTVFAADTITECSVTITNDVDTATHTYKVYEVFTGTVNGTNLMVSGWGNGVDPAGIVADLKAAYPTDFAHVVYDAADPAFSAQEVANILDNIGKTEGVAWKVAGIIADNLAATPSKTMSSAVAADLGVGYYLITDTITTDKEQSVVSPYLLKVANDTPINIKISEKIGTPTLVKKVEEIDYTGEEYEANTDYNDVADYSIGDDINFKLYADIPASYKDYQSKYKLTFVDTICDGLTFDATSVVVTVIGDTTKELAAAQFEVDTTAGGFEVIVDDLKACGVNNITKVTVEYTAKLNDNAVIGLDGNVNGALLQYSNNPNFSGDADKTPGSPDDGDEDEDYSEGNTPEDKVIVFTYQLDVTKVDAVDNTVKLANVEFVLKNEAGKYYNYNAANKTLTWETDIANAKVFKTSVDGQVSIPGLEDGNYTLVETKNPNSGYESAPNKEIPIIITAQTANGQAWNDFDASAALTGLEITVDGAAAQAGDLTAGTVAAQIVNSKSSNLPQTGGIGTKIFYTAGGIMVFGAGVTLIAKKRMKNK